MGGTHVRRTGVVLLSPQPHVAIGLRYANIVMGRSAGNDSECRPLDMLDIGRAKGQNTLKLDQCYSQLSLTLCVPGSPVCRSHSRRVSIQKGEAEIPHRFDNRYL